MSILSRSKDLIRLDTQFRQIGKYGIGERLLEETKKGRFSDPSQLSLIHDFLSVSGRDPIEAIRDPYWDQEARLRMVSYLFREQLGRQQLNRMHVALGLMIQDIVLAKAPLEKKKEAFQSVVSIDPKYLNGGEAVFGLLSVGDIDASTQFQELRQYLGRK